MSAKTIFPRLSAFISVGALLTIPAVYYGCGIRDRGVSVGIAIPPDFAPVGSKATLVVRLLHPDRPSVGIPGEFFRLTNNNPGLRLEFDAASIANGSLFEIAPRINFLPNDEDRALENLVNTPTVGYAVLYHNTLAEVDEFTQLAAGDQQFLSADARVNHDDSATPEIEGIEGLTPAGFAVFVFNPDKSEVRLVSLMPYEFGGTSIDADNDGIVTFSSSTFNGEACPFEEPISTGDLSKRKGKKIKDLQCETLGGAIEGLESVGLTTEGLDCNDGNANINQFEVDECGDLIDQATCNDPATPTSCAPTDADGDGSCECILEAGSSTKCDPLSGTDLANNPVFLATCFNDAASGRPGDCRDNDPDVFQGASIDEASCETNPAPQGNEDVDCDGEPDFCDCDTDQDGFCPESLADCDDNDPNISPNARDICGNGIDEDCNGADSACEPADADGDGHCRRSLAFYDRAEFRVNGTITLPGIANIQPQPEPFADPDLIFACLTFDDCNDANRAEFPGNPTGEICNDNFDNDCNPATGDDSGACAADNDGDGDPNATDCAPGDSSRSSLKVEICGNGNDDDCDGNDIGCAGITDVDGDGVEDSLEALLCPGVPEATVANTNDVAALRVARLTFPGAKEFCDGIDNDCDTFIDEGNPDDLFFAANNTTNIPDIIFELNDRDLVNNPNSNGAAKDCGGTFDISDQSDPLITTYSDDLIPNNLSCQRGFLVCSPEFVANVQDGASAICVGSIAPRVEVCEGLPVSLTPQPGFRLDSSAPVANIVGNNLFPVDDDCDAGTPAIEADLDGDRNLECNDNRTVIDESDCRVGNPNSRFAPLDDVVNLFPSVEFTGVPAQLLDIPADVGAFVAPNVSFCDGDPDDCQSLSNTETDDDNDGQVECNLNVSIANFNTNGGVNLDDDTPGGDCNDADADVKAGGLSLQDDNVNALANGEVCDNKDNNCNGQIDEGCDDDGDDFCESNIDVFDNTACPNTPVGLGNDCNDVLASNGFFVRPGGILAANGGVGGEICDDIENECAADGVDEGCDDDNDNFCDTAMLVRSATGGVATCSATTTGSAAGFGAAGNDCNDASNTTFPNAPERCGSTVEEDCGTTAGDNNGCNDDGDNFCDTANFVVSNAVCTGNTNNTQGTDCNDASNLFFPNAPERCGSGQQEDCGTVAGDSNGCNDDGDNFCDTANFVVSNASLCSGNANNTQGTDCNDTSNTTFPNAPERCGSGVEEDCATTAGDNNGCNDDNDNFCDTANFVVNNAVCTGNTNNTQGTDCIDNNNLAFPGAAERCGSGIDEDCSGAGSDNNGCNDDGDNFCDTANFVVNNAVCTGNTNGTQGTDCNDASNTTFPNAPERCGSTIEEDCATVAGDNNGCNDDGDNFCDTANFVVSNAVCTGNTNNTQGTDCNDASNLFFPNAPERCGSGQQEDCGTVAGDNNGCNDDGDNFCDTANFVVNNAGLCTGNTNNTQGTDCNDASANFFPNAAERCGSGAEEDCGTVAGDSNGCDDDNDDFCDSANFVVNGTTAGCASSANNAIGNDCNDNPATGGANFFPGAAERCGSGADEDCAGNGDNNGCNDDGDNFCDTANFVVNNAVCTGNTNGTQGTDCNDASANFFPNAAERCGSGAEEDCGTVAGDSNGCDDDNDNFCDSANFVVNGTTAGCTGSANNATGNDCNDAVVGVNPGAAERCGSGVDEDCGGGDNNGCNDDGDGFCDSANFVVNAATAGCASNANNAQGTDCNDAAAAINPGAVERCGSGIDEDCNGGAGSDNNGCDDDNDNFCDSANFVVNGTTAGCTGSANNATGNDCNDAVVGVNPGAAERCGSGVDEDCSAGDNNGCNDDGDGFCDSANFVVNGATAGCASSANNAQGTDCNDAVAAINPGATEICDNLDNDCGADVDEGCDDDGDNFCDANIAKAAVSVTTCTNTAAAATVGDDCDDAAAGTSPDPTDAIVCETEANNSTGTADNAGAVRSMDIRAVGDGGVDFFVMTLGSATTTLDIDTGSNVGGNQCNGGLDTALVILEADGTTVAASDDPAGCATLNNITLPAGTFFIQVTGNINYFVNVTP